MSKIVTYTEYMNMLSERTIDNTRQLKKSVTQRRNGMEDLYGVFFTGNGDSGNPAKFYISLSPDFVYLQRLAFKLVIKPFTTTIQGATESATVTVNNRSLSTDGSSITPNPHNHGTQPHTHNVINGMAFVPTTSTSWQIKVAGVDISAYLREQQDGAWISGQGIYPTNRLEDVEDFYDILDVASVMMAEGRTADANKLIEEPRFKMVEIISDAPFKVDAYFYVKYSNLNR